MKIWTCSIAQENDSLKEAGGIWQTGGGIRRNWSVHVCIKQKAYLRSGR